MRINFFEEYPTEESLSKLGLIHWPSIVFIATQTLKDFELIRDTYATKHPHITFGWWPTLPNSYWVSGLANPHDLNRLFADITSKKQTIELPVLLDLELPKNISSYFKNFFHLTSNKRKIKNFLLKAPEHNLNIYTAEYPALNNLTLRILQFLGISPSFEITHTKIPMCYSSLITKMYGAQMWSWVKKFQEKLVHSYPNRVAYGLGTIATGVLGNEPILDADTLSADMTWAKKTRVKNVFIFRLGGLNTEHVSIITHLLI